MGQALAKSACTQSTLTVCCVSFSGHTTDTATELSMVFSVVKQWLKNQQQLEAAQTTTNNNRSGQGKQRGGCLFLFFCLCWFHLCASPLSFSGVGFVMWTICNVANNYSTGINPWRHFFEVRKLDKQAWVSELSELSE